MESNNTKAISDLGGTTWSVNTSQNVQGTFQFKIDNTGSYTTNADPKQDFFWWQKGNSFWMQVISPGWLALMEGRLTASNSGGGNIITAQQESGFIVVVEFQMTKNS